MGSLKRKDSFTRFFIGLLITSLLPITILTLLVYFSSIEIIKTKEKEFVTAKIDIINQQLDQSISQMENVLLLTMSNKTIISHLQNPQPPVSFEWYRQIQEVENILTSITPIENLQKKYSIIVIGNNNHVYQNSTYASIIQDMYSDYVQKIIKSDQSIVFFDRSLSSSSENYVGMGKKIIVDNKFLGVVIVEINNKALNRQLLISDNENYHIFAYKKPSELVYTNTTSKTLTESVLDRLRLDTAFSDKLRSDGESYICISDEKTNNNVNILALLPERYTYQSSDKFLEQNMIFISVVVVLSVAFTAVITRKKLRMDDEKRRHLEFIALQTQINPHMIFNTMKTITYLARLQGTQNIENVSTSFSNLLRIICKTDGEFITIEQELEYVTGYVNIKRYSILCDINLNISVEEKLKQHSILKLILQPLVENSIKHGFTDQTALDISVDVRSVDDKQIFITVTDNGCGISDDDLAKINNNVTINNDHYLSIGIQNIKGRLELQYGKKAYLTIANQPKGSTVVTIVYPL